jgi:hypothetical protein
MYISIVRCVSLTLNNFKLNITLELKYIFLLILLNIQLSQSLNKGCMD